ncbi:ORC complex protein Cdc6/Orc1 [Thermofilum pendens Hrk 5]|uniref:ORC1-type DNA replication protein n=2 Tax=Thermofilum pendens TaxID=2269 RepID=A1RYJ2_THEPD|nr:ORC complex protein Cdc6/Orc1 [Thermofilum pendens Hrk 5]
MILANPSALSSRYVPRRLPHREPQIERLASLFPELPKAPFFRVVQLIGPTGTGKTSTSLFFARSVEQQSENVSTIYVNLKSLRSRDADGFPWIVYTSILSQLGAKPSRSLSAAEVFMKVVGELSRRQKKLHLVIVDEADELTGPRSLQGGQIVYNLTRLPELGVSNVAGVIFIARNDDWARGLAPEEKSSLGALVVRFPPYTLSQLVDILLYRASEALASPEALPEPVAEYIAEITVDMFERDVRKALDVLLYSALIADKEGSDKITRLHVTRALAEIMGRSYLDDDAAKMLGRTERIVLAAALRAAGSSDTIYVSEQRVLEEAQAICERLGIPPLGRREIATALQRLHDLGYIKVSGPLKIFVNLVAGENVEELLLGNTLRKARGSYNR